MSVPVNVPANVPVSGPTAVPDTAIVLAAGLGKRMRPLTDTVPKPLVAVAGRPLIDHGLGALERAGVSEAIVNVHYLADALEAHVAGRERPRVTISDERERLLDSGGGIRNALSLTDADPVLILNADTFWRDAPGADNITALAAAWDAGAMDILLMLAPLDRAVGHSTGRGDFAIDSEGRLTRSAQGHVYAGAAILSRSIFRGDEPDAHSLNLHFDRAIEAGRLHGHLMDGLWLTVGTPDAIPSAEDALAEYDRASAA